MEIRQTTLDGVLEFVPRRYGDHRGWFRETWNDRAWRDAGLRIDWVQDNESYSARAGTVRGVHFQTGASAQDKLVRVAAGRIRDIAVDLRRSSATFGQWVARELSAVDGNQLLVPKGFGHAFITLQDDCLVSYKVSAFFDAESDAAVNWLDPDLAIDWGVEPEKAILSDKDAAAPVLADAAHLLFD